MPKTSESVVARESQHSPLPWVAAYADVNEDGDRWSVCTAGRRQFFIATIENGAPGDCLDSERANAEFIVRACNAHTSLVEALQATREFLSQFVEEMEELHGLGTDSTEELLEFFDDNQSNPHAEYYRLVGMGRKAIEQAEQALRLAQGGK